MIGGMPWKQSQVKPENDDMEKIIWDFIERGISEEGDRDVNCISDLPSTFASRGQTCVKFLKLVPEITIERQSRTELTW